MNSGKESKGSWEHKRGAETKRRGIQQDVEVEEGLWDEESRVFRREATSSHVAKREVGPRPFNAEVFVRGSTRRDARATQQGLPKPVCRRGKEGLESSNMKNDELKNSETRGLYQGFIYVACYI